MQRWAVEGLAPFIHPSLTCYERHPFPSGFRLWSDPTLPAQPKVRVVYISWRAHAPGRCDLVVWSVLPSNDRWLVATAGMEVIVKSFKVQSGSNFKH